jgi:hypothetical protein
MPPLLEFALFFVAALVVLALVHMLFEGPDDASKNP